MALDGSTATVVQEVPGYENFIGGEWRPARSGQTMESYDPATGAPVSRAARSGPEDVDEAVSAARRGLEASVWGEDPALRARVLARMADALEARKDALAELNTRETGKPLRESQGEVLGSIDTLRYASGMARNVSGRTRINAADSLSLVLRQPLGVVAQVVPWNYPVILLFRELAPALAAGNAVIVKPASLTSGITAELVRTLVGAAELPPGILSLVTGGGDSVGTALVSHRGIDMIAFTGSVETGKAVYRAAASNVRKAHLELGGKSPNVLFADADLERALPTILQGALVNAGQFCMCGSRLLVEESIHDQVVAWLVGQVEGWRVGSGLDPETRMGPVVSQEQLDRVLGYCDRGQGEAELLSGGRRLTGPAHARGYFMAPTIFDRVPLSTSLAQEEIFGPVLVVQGFRSEQEALELANGTRFGLVAGVWTRSLDRAMRMSQRIRAGTVWVNTYNRLFAELEFGGSKESGLGRTRGLEGLNEFTEVKHVNVQLGAG